MSKHFMKKLLLLFIYIFIANGLSAQNDSISLFNNKLSINIGLSNVQSNRIELPPVIFNGHTYERAIGGQQNPQFNFEIGYDLSKSLTLSGYFAYSNVRVNTLNSVDSMGYSYTSGGMPTFSYGLNMKYHLLPLFLKPDNLRLDVYAIGRFGVLTMYEYQQIDDNWQKVWLQPDYEYGIGLGATYYFKKRWGIFGECFVGDFFNDSFTRFKVGLIFKF